MPARPPVPRPGAVTPPTPELQGFLTYRLHKLHKLSDAASADAYARHCGLPLGEARCLAAIGAFAPLSVNDLAQRANLNKAQASRAAQSLVDQGLVSKATSPHDARGVVLKPTRRGKALHTRLMALVAQRNDEIFGCLSAVEQRLLSEMFGRLIARAEGEAG